MRQNQAVRLFFRLSFGCFSGFRNAVRAPLELATRTPLLYSYDRMALRGLRLKEGGAADEVGGARVGFAVGRIRQLVVGEGDFQRRIMMDGNPGVASTFPHLDISSCQCRLRRRVAAFPARSAHRRLALPVASLQFRHRTARHGAAPCPSSADEEISAFPTCLP